MKKLLLKRRVDQIQQILIFFIIYVIGNFIKNNKKYENIWIISERYNEARDNGYHLFRYIRENYPEINLYYIIDKNATDKKEINKLGNIINFRSFKHYFYYLIAEKVISTHINGCSPDDKIFPSLIKRICMSKKRKNVFLQHGIIKDTLPLLYYNITKLDLFVCGAEPEFKFVNEKFGYKKNEVKYLGLARFDELHNFKEKKQILLMPTFRMWLITQNKIKTSKEYKEFTKTQYYSTYQSLINNKKISKLLEEHNINLIFYPHYEAQYYIDLFTTSSKNIKIANKKDYDVQKLLKESKLLITDYSSVYFDFAYMRKPVLYYQFDYEVFRENHYNEGYFDYQRDGFGDVETSEEQLVKKIEILINNNFDDNEKYKKRIEKFFPLFDLKNRERNFRAIYEL